jgi:hypothetical protein
MDRLHAPNEFLRIRRLRERMRAWEQLRRLLADGRTGSRAGRATTAQTRYTAYSYLKGGLISSATVQDPRSS